MESRKWAFQCFGLINNALANAQEDFVLVQSGQKQNFPKCHSILISTKEKQKRIRPILFYWKSDKKIRNIWNSWPFDIHFQSMPIFRSRNFSREYFMNSENKMKIKGTIALFPLDFKPFDCNKIIIEWSANWFSIANCSLAWTMLLTMRHDFFHKNLNRFSSHLSTEIFFPGEPK